MSDFVLCLVIFFKGYDKIKSSAHLKWEEISTFNVVVICTDCIGRFR